MAHFAKVENGTVTEVIVAEQNFIDTLNGHWIQTSYNTRSGEHILGGTPLRKNYAGVGFTYDVSRDAFIPPQPYTSWVLNETTCNWESPIPYPDDDNDYEWDEDLYQSDNTQGWVAR